MIFDEQLVEAIERLMVEAIGITTIVIAQSGSEVELTFAQWRALAVVGSAESGIRVGELAARIGSTVSTTSRLVRRLEVRGLVLAERDDIDRRATRVRLTDGGRALRLTLVGRRQQFVRDALASCQGPLSKELIPGLRQIGEALRTYA
jgi:DNA-binding MarR family transcriptional regulator